MTLFSEITDLNDPRVEAAIALYDISFPANEKQPVQVIRDRISKGQARLFVGEADGQLLLMSLFYVLTDDEFMLLDFLAVDPAAKGQGIGSMFLAYIAGALLKESKYFILEVEDPAFGEDRQGKEKRVGFYRKNGVKTLQGVNYMLPALDGTTPTPMILMILPGYHLPVISRQRIRELVTLMYREVYNKPTEDPLLNSFIDTIPEEVRVG